MFKWLFCVARKRKPAQPAVNGALLIKDLGADNGPAGGSVVPLRSEAGSALTRRKDGSELFSEAVNKLVDKLEGINANLDRQVSQNERLVAKMDALPELLTRLPQTMERQERFLDEISGQVRQRIVHDEQTIRELSGIHEKITSCVDIDARMSEHIDGVAQAVGRMTDSTLGQTELLGHLNRSYLSTEQYLRESLERQQRRFYWLFGISLAISLLAAAAIIVMVTARLGS